MTERYVSLDLETTGLNPKLDKIIEIGAVKVDKGVITERYSTFVNPGITLGEHTGELTGIRQEDVNAAPSIGEVLSSLLDFLEDLPLVGHKIVFDFSFVKKAAVDAKLSFERKGIDTLRLSRVFLPQLEKKTLSDMCAYYQIPITAHRAFSDAEATALLYERLRQDFGEKEPAFFEPVSLRYKVKRDTPATVAQKEQLAKLLEKHRLTADFDWNLLSRSEASRRITRMLQVYGR